MKAYRAQLLEKAAQLAESQPVPRQPKQDSRIHCEVPLREQVIELMASLPPALRERPWSMEEFKTRLQGRYNQSPSAGDIGLVLRSLGWQRQRVWSGEYSGRRVWVR